MGTSSSCYSDWRQLCLKTGQGSSVGGGLLLQAAVEFNPRKFFSESGGFSDGGGGKLQVICAGTCLIDPFRAIANKLRQRVCFLSPLSPDGLWRVGLSNQSQGGTILQATNY